MPELQEIGTNNGVQKILGGKKQPIVLKEEERTRCSIWSRVMGYHRPVSYYNIGKKQEFADRLNFKEPKEK